MEDEEFQHRVPEGVFTVRVFRARLKDAGRYARVPDEPQLAVQGVATIQGRRYTVHVNQTRYLGETTDRHGKPIRWDHGEAPYQGGYRRADGKPLDWQTKAYSRLREIVTDALDAYHATHPGWDNQSRLLALHYEREHRQDEVLSALKALQFAESQVAAVDQAIALTRAIGESGQR